MLVKMQTTTIVMRRLARRRRSLSLISAVVSIHRDPAFGGSQRPDDIRACRRDLRSASKIGLIDKTGGAIEWKQCKFVE